MSVGLRIGSGFDAHAFAAGRRLVIGGVTIPHAAGLAGESDADVLYHAVADALLGAAGEGDLGRHFPPGDPRWEGLDSAVILERVRRVVGDAGLCIENVDATVIAQRPRLSGHLSAMGTNLARVLRIDRGRVNVKGKSTDRLGFVGREEGIAALATVLLAERLPRATHAAPRFRVVHRPSRRGSARHRGVTPGPGAARARRGRSRLAS